MKQIANIFIMIALLSVQTFDIGVLDIENEAVEAIHADLGIDGNQSITDHDIHCGCDMFHHMFNSLNNNSNLHFLNMKTTFNEFENQISDQINGPPVPPPLA